MSKEKDKSLKFERQDWQLATVLVVVLILALASHLVTLETLYELEAPGTNLMGVYDGTENLRSLDRHLIELVQAQDNFLISGEEPMAQKAEESIQGIEKDLAGIERFFQNELTNPYLIQLKDLVRKKIDFHRTVINTTREKGEIAATQLLDLEGGTVFRDSILQITDSLRHFHRQHMLNYLGKKSKLATKLELISLASVAFVFLIAVFAIYYLTKTAKHRRQLLNNLMDAKEKAERAAFLKEQFIANMSHEIRTPLNAIIGFSNLLDRTPLQANQPEFVHSIRTSSENLLSIINDILDFSKIEAGALRLEKISFSLSGLISSVENMFRYREQENTLALRVAVDEKIPDRLLGDPMRLTQILVNLLGNAFKFTNKGQVELVVKQCREEGDQVLIRFEIRDTGIGIAPEQLDTIFDRFSQASAETTRKYGGAGLGLTITRQLVEIQNGTIQVKSEVGKGTTFVVELFYQIAPDSDQALKQNAAIKTSLNFAEICILLVEDNPMNRRVAELLLDEWGFRHDHAANGRIALEMVTKKRYDLVLMDIQMPEMDGYTATQQIRRELGLQVPIIATTAHAFAGEREKCLSYGMNDYISKPLREEELMEVIGRFIQAGKKGGSSLHSQQPDPLSIEKLSVPDFDRDYVLEIAKNKPETVQEMIKIFLGQSKKELQAMENALSEKNFGLAATAAHSMRSTVSYMGFAASLGTLLQEFESETRKEPASLALLWEQFNEIKVATNTAAQFVQQEFLKSVM